MDFALVAAVVHILAFVWETLLFQRPWCASGFLRDSNRRRPPRYGSAFNVGFYNLFIAGGLMAGLIIWMNGNESAGRALVIYLSLSAFLAGIALFASDPPLVALIAVPLIN